MRNAVDIVVRQAVMVLAFLVRAAVQVLLIVRAGMFEPMPNNIIHLKPRHVNISPAHGTVDGSDTGERIGLDNGCRIGCGITGILKMDTLFHCRRNRKDTHDGQIHQEKHCERHHQRRAMFLASQIEKTPKHHAAKQRGIGKCSCTKVVFHVLFNRTKCSRRR